MQHTKFVTSHAPFKFFKVIGDALSFLETGWKLNKIFPCMIPEFSMFFTKFACMHECSIENFQADTTRIYARFFGNVKCDIQMVQQTVFSRLIFSYSLSRSALLSLARAARLSSRVIRMAIMTPSTTQKPPTRAIARIARVSIQLRSLEN